ncbi:hypothetical protein IWQ60_000641 [Tieghemiomyces parasiticus]|uniref:Uncharacterized protein n=1 Tax=Tieghemiomyces parasiticus TaxID=78921 RepID=A0A9W8AG42_9FUNG|nr:hypothetical protein IWQ60_000641 [Tieghemiomyces parasiticus]
MDGRFINITLRPASKLTHLAEALSMVPLVTVVSLSEEGAPLIEIYVKRPGCSTGKLSMIKPDDRDYATRTYKDAITQRHGQDN